MYWCITYCIVTFLFFNQSIRIMLFINISRRWDGFIRVQSVLKMKYNIVSLFYLYLSIFVPNKYCSTTNAGKNMNWITRGMKKNSWWKSWTSIWPERERSKSKRCLPLLWKLAEYFSLFIDSKDTTQRGKVGMDHFQMLIAKVLRF